MFSAINMKCENIISPHGCDFDNRHAIDLR